jgi:predicted DNA binding CopG/RHH family protein
MKNTSKIPKFANKTDETAYWNSQDSTKVVDWTMGKVGLFPNLKPSTQSISIRLPKALIEELKILANKKDVPYQSLLKIYLSERVEKELHPV